MYNLKEKKKKKTQSAVAYFRTIGGFFFSLDIDYRNLVNSGDKSHGVVRVVPMTASPWNFSFSELSTLLLLSHFSRV